MEMEESEKTQSEPEVLNLIDLSSQNDLRFSVSLTDPKTCELEDEEEEDKISIGIDEIHQFPELHDTAEPEMIQRNKKYNLRKSLAWDSAFFTSAGVLDPEELSTMFSGMKKSEKHVLPGIEEDITGSTESISTFESDVLTMDSLESDLFGDIRASIQRSSKKAASSTHSSNHSKVVETDNTSISTLNKEEIDSENKNLKSVLKKTGGLQNISMPKCQPKQNMMPGSRKVVKQDPGCSQMKSTIKTGEPKCVPKPPKAISKYMSLSTAAVKQDSSGRTRTESDRGSSKLVLDKGLQPSKALVVSGPRRPLPRPTLSSKSSSSSSSTASSMQPTKSSFSSDSSSNVSSNTPSKYLPKATRKNPVRSSSAGTASSGPIPKNSSRVALKNKPSPSTILRDVMSTKISSSVSPASSISEWSSASSSSSMIFQRSDNSRNSLDDKYPTSMSNSEIILSDPGNHTTDQTTDGRGLPGNSSSKSSARAGTLQVPVKPSGLRMPSPKIGYFDGVKSSACTPKKTLQSPHSLHTVIPKSGTAVNSPIQSSSIKLRSGKIPTARIVTAVANNKPVPPQAKSPTSFKGISSALEDPCLLTNKKESISWPLDVKGDETGEGFLKVWKVQVEGAKEVDADAGALIKGNKDGLISETDFNMDKNTITGDAKIREINPSDSIALKVDEDGLVEQNHLKIVSNQICKAEDKENGNGENPGQVLKVQDGDVNPSISSPMAAILKDISDCASISFSETASESTAARAPFALMNLLCNIESLDVFKESI